MAKSKTGDSIAKTNAMRELDSAGVQYDALPYGVEDEVSRGLGGRVAEAAGIDPASSLKTLVCRRAPQGDLAVFCIPCEEQLDLKKAARAAGCKSLSMLAVRDLPSATGYVRGGCSPIGMRRQSATFIDETAQLFDQVYVSAGHIGMSVRLAPSDLARVTGASFSDLTADGHVG